MLIVAVSGWRDYRDGTFVHKCMAELVTGSDEPVHVRVGDAPGADRLVEDWCSREGTPYTIYFAKWAELGKAAGPERNRRMLTQEIVWNHDNPQWRPRLADMLLAFPQPCARPKIPGSGTWGCVGEAFILGIKVIIP